MNNIHFHPTNDNTKTNSVSSRVKQLIMRGKNQFRRSVREHGVIHTVIGTTSHKRLIRLTVLHQLVGWTLGCMSLNLAIKNGSVKRDILHPVQYALNQHAITFNMNRAKNLSNEDRQYYTKVSKLSVRITLISAFFQVLMFLNNRTR